MKYTLTENIIKYNGITLYQIQAIKDFSDVKKGDLGGYIETQKNLSQVGDAWVYNNARVFGDAEVYGRAKIRDEAEVYDKADVSGDAIISGEARIYGNARIYNNAKVYGEARIYGNARIYNNAKVYDEARIYDEAYIYGNAKVYDDSIIFNNAKVYDDACVHGYLNICGDARVCSKADISSESDILNFTHLGKDFRSVTAFKCTDSKWAVICGNFIGTIKTVATALKNNNREEDVDFKLILPLLRRREKLSQKKRKDKNND